MIYFIQQGMDGPIKIGKAISPRKRLKTLQVGSPDTLHLLAIEKGGHGREKHLHDRYTKERIRGEWFKSSERLLDYARRLPDSNMKAKAWDIIDKLAPPAPRPDNPRASKIVQCLIREAKARIGNPQTYRI